MTPFVCIKDLKLRYVCCRAKKLYKMRNYPHTCNTVTRTRTNVHLSSHTYLSHDTTVQILHRVGILVRKSNEIETESVSIFKPQETTQWRKAWGTTHCIPENKLRPQHRGYTEWPNLPSPVASCASKLNISRMQCSHTCAWTEMKVKWVSHLGSFVSIGKSHLNISTMSLLSEGIRRRSAF